jgi:hypothetical protein
MSSYDAWKTRSDYDEEARYYSGPSHKQLREKVETLDREIGWLTTRLANLSLSDEDFDQTQDSFLSYGKSVNLLNGASMSKEEDNKHQATRQAALARRELERQALLLLAAGTVAEISKACEKAKHVEQMLRKFIAKETRADFDAAS